MSDFTNFRAVYDELTDEVMRARGHFTNTHLRNWIEHLDETPSVARIVSELQDGLDFEAWWQKSLAGVDEETGMGVPSWPKPREKALGMQLLLFRSLSDGSNDMGEFGYTFANAGINDNENIQSVVANIFAPTARHLRRLLEERLDAQTEAPASDRTVSLDHNSRTYMDADEAMAELEKAIREANDFDDPLEKEQLEAEVSAARRLMKATRVRLVSLAALVRPVLTQFATKVKDNLVTAAALAVSGTLITLFGPFFRALIGL